MRIKLDNLFFRDGVEKVGVLFGCKHQITYENIALGRLSKCERMVETWM